MKKYEAIANEIRSRIKNGIYTDKEPLPEEMTLCKEFDCSRMTMKKALEQLVLDGLVYRKRGHGTFIMKSVLGNGRLNLDSRSLQGLSASVVDGQVESELISFSVEIASEDVRQHLDLVPNSLVYHIIRVRKLNGEPYVIEKMYMPTLIVTGMNEDVLKGSVYQYIQQELGLKIASSQKVIRADQPNELDQQYLGCQENEPVLEVEQVAYLHNGNAFEYSFSRHRFDKFEFTSYSVKR